MHPFYRWEQFHLQQALAMLGARFWMLPLLCKRTHSELLAFHQSFASVLLVPCDALPAEPVRAFDEPGTAPEAPRCCPSEPSSPMAEARRRVRRRPTPVFPR